MVKMKNLNNKKIWEKPTIETLKIKKDTASGAGIGNEKATKGLS